MSLLGACKSQLGDTSYLTALSSANQTSTWDFSRLIIQWLLSDWIGVFLHVRYIPHQNSQRCFWASVWQSWDGGGEEEAEEAAGYRIKNKNSTQRCRQLQQQLLPQLQLQPHHTTRQHTKTTNTLPYARHSTLYHTTRGEVTTATIATFPENTTPTIFRSINGFALPSLIHNNQPLLYVSYCCFRHCLVRYYWFTKYSDFGVRVFCHSFHFRMPFTRSEGVHFFLVLFVLTFLQLNSCLFLQYQVAFFLGSAAVQGQACLHLMHGPAKNHNARNQIKVQIFRNSKTRTCIIHALNLSWKLMSTGCLVWPADTFGLRTAPLHLRRWSCWWMPAPISGTAAPNQDHSEKMKRSEHRIHRIHRIHENWPAEATKLVDLAHTQPRKILSETWPWPGLDILCFLLCLTVCFQASPGIQAFRLASHHPAIASCARRNL